MLVSTHMFHLWWLYVKPCLTYKNKYILLGSVLSTVADIIRLLLWQPALAQETLGKLAMLQYGLFLFV
jgi:hypothetical protein